MLRAVFFAALLTIFLGVATLSGLFGGPVRPSGTDMNRRLTSSPLRRLLLSGLSGLALDALSLV